jgi:hypothetical protein
MVRGKASGYTLTQADVAIVLGMQARGDREHDIAAWFGVNQGRMADAKEGKFGTPPMAPGHTLPPKGPPGVKGRRLKSAVDRALDVLAKHGPAGLSEATAILNEGKARYDANEA